MHKTYTKGSRHNVPRDDVAGLGLRVSQLTKRKIEVAANAARKTIKSFCVDLLEDAVCSVVLTEADLEIVKTKTAEQRKRNLKKISDDYSISSNDPIAEIMRVIEEA